MCRWKQLLVQAHVSLEETPVLRWYNESAFHAYGVAIRRRDIGLTAEQAGFYASARTSDE